MGKVFDLNGKDLTKTDATLRVPEEPADAAAVGKQSDAQTESLKAEKSRAEGAEKKLQQQVDTLNAGGLNLKEDLIRTQVDSYLTQHPEAMGTALAEETTRAKTAEEENAKGIGRLGEDIKINGFNKDSLVVFYGDIIPTAPYDDCNTVPSNSIVSYGSILPANVPEDITGTLISFGDSTGNVVGGQTQMYMTSTSHLYARIAWGSSSNVYWLSWKRLDNTDAAFNPTQLKFISNPSAPYDDCNTVPANSIVSYGKNLPSNLPEEITGTLISFGNRTDSVSGGQTQFYMTSTSHLYVRVAWGASSNVYWLSWKRLDNQGNYISTGCYKNFGVIGDSYASGETYYNGSYHDNYYCSWGQILARKLGNTCYNFSSGGLTTRSWLTYEKGLALLNSSPACDLYWCMLGINDAEKLGSEYLGSISDIHEDSSENPDTFYGNYSKIISAILKKQPNATIIMCNIVHAGTKYDAFSAAIKEIAEYYEVMFIDTHTSFFLSKEFKNTMVHGHPTNQTYTGMANALDNLFSANYYDYHTYLFEHYNGYVD